MELFGFVFYNKAGQGLVNSDEIIAAIDQKSIILDTALGYGERSLKFNITATEKQTQPFYNFFKNSVYKVELKLRGDVVWVGRLDQGSPTLSNYNGGPMSVSFSGFFILLNRLVDKLWIDTQSVKSLVPGQNNENQLNGNIEHEGNGIKVEIVARERRLDRGEIYHRLRYKANGGYYIEDIKADLGFRCGEGLVARGENGATVFFSVGLDETGDQVTLVNYPLPVTKVTGTLTDSYILGFGFSDYGIFNFNYGATENLINVVMTDPQNAIIAPFVISGSGTISIDGIKTYLGFNTFNETVQVAICDNDYSNIRVFDTIVNIPADTPDYYTFTRAVAVSIDRGVMYRVLIFISPATPPNLTYISGGYASAANPPHPSFVLDGYLSIGNMATVNDAPTGISPITNRWQQIELIPEATESDLINQDDKITVTDLTTRLKYHPSHPQYLVPSYTAKELLIDMVLETLPEYSTDFSTIAADIFGGAPIDYSGITTFESVQASDLIKKLLLLSQSEYYYTVYGYNNGGVPRLNVVKRIIPTVADYIVSTKDDNVTVEIDSVTTIRNYVLVTYTDSDGVPRRLTPRKNVQLKNQASIDTYDRQDYEIDLGSVSETEALEMGKGIIANYSYPRPSGTITVMGYIRAAVQTHGYHVSRVKAGQTIQVFNFTDPNKQTNPIYIIGSAAYTSANDQLIIRLDEVDQNEAFFNNIKKPTNKFS